MSLNGTTLPHILLIDDDMQFTHLINEIMVRHQYQLSVAHNFPELTLMFTQENGQRKRPYDLVLLDLLIAGLDGKVVLQWLRNQPQTSDTPIIVLSAVEDIGRRIELIELGADDYLKKPFPIDELLARIAIYLKLGRVREEKRKAEQQVRIQSHHLQAINAIGSMITQYLEQGQMLYEFVHSLVQFFDCETCAIYLYVQQNTELILAAHSDGLTQSQRPPLPTILFHSASAQRPLVMNNEASIPIVRDDVLLGYLFLRHPTQISPNTIQALEILSVQLAITLTNIYLFQDIQQNNQQLKQLVQENSRLLTREKNQRQHAEQMYNMAQAMGSLLDMEQVLMEAMNAIQNMIQVELGSIVLVNEKTGKLSFMHSLISEPDLNMTLLEPGEGIVGKVIQSGRPLVVNDVHAHPAFLPTVDHMTGKQTRSILCVPLIAQEHTIGAIELLNKHQGDFDEVDLKLVSSAATSIAIAIDNARLYQKQADLIEQLQQSQAQIVQSEKLAATGRLAASLAHEINNPLQAIHSCLQLATHFDLGPEKQKEYLGMASEEVERLVDIVSRILDFARPSAGKFEQASINKVIGQVLQLSHKHTMHHNVTIVQVLGSDVPPISMIPDQVGQVFMAIILNAFDAMSGLPGTLQITTRVRNNMVEAIFADSGIGIDPEVLPHIFEPFFSTKPQGSGLGLTISFGIVERHKGQIEVDSDLGLGSTVTVRLPRTQEAKW